MKFHGPIRALGEVSEIIMGQSPDGRSYNAKGLGVPLINGPVEFSSGSFGPTVRTKFTTEPTKLCRTGDLILCVRGSTTGRTNIAAFDACIGRGVAVIRAREYQPWINYAIRWKRDDIYNLGTGSTFPNVSASILSQIPIHYPPALEQQRIVNILDEAFEGIATAKANAEKNLQNARAVFAGHLEVAFKVPHSNWESKQLGAVAEVQSGGTPSVANKSYWNGRIAWYSSGELNSIQTGSPERTISTLGLENSSAKVFPRGSLLIGMYDTAALKMSILDREAAFNQAIAAVKPNGDLEMEFLLHFISAVKPRILRERRGVRQKNLSLAKIKEILVPMPNIEVQRGTVLALKTMADLTRRLESTYRQKLAALDELKKSLLHRAFSGQL